VSHGTLLSHLLLVVLDTYQPNLNDRNSFLKSNTPSPPQYFLFELLCWKIQFSAKIE